MAKIRVSAALLSILSLLAAAFLLLRSTGLVTVALVVLAAACLAVVAPFDAPDPPKRKRVLAGCVGYVAGILVATALAARSPDEPYLAQALLFLAGCGAVLGGWAFRVRNWRRHGGLRPYYEG